MRHVQAKSNKRSGDDVWSNNSAGQLTKMQATEQTLQNKLHYMSFLSGVLLILRSDRICLPVMQIGCRHAPGACSIACAVTSIIDHLSALASAKYFESEDKCVLLTGSFFSCTENCQSLKRNVALAKCSDANPAKPPSLRVLYSNRAGFASSGIRPSRCASTSSCSAKDGPIAMLSQPKILVEKLNQLFFCAGMNVCLISLLTVMIDVLLMKNTCSIAMLGTSAMRMRLNALAIAGSIPIMSNFMSNSSFCCTFTRN